MQGQPHIVIVGGGIVGCATLYYLASSSFGGKITLIENCENVGSCASGHAGGFLSKHWCDGEGALESLSRASFDLHCSFAKGKEKEIGFRFLPAVSVAVTANNHNQNKEHHNPFGLLSNVIDTDSVEDLTPEHKKSPNTAQVHPGLLCASFVSESLKFCSSDETRKLEIDILTSTSVNELMFDDSGNKCIGVCVENREHEKQQKQIHSHLVVLCLGPWTGHIEKKMSSFRSPTTISSSPYLIALSKSFQTLKVQSILIDTKIENNETTTTTTTSASSIPCAIFTYPTPDSGFGSCEPEIYPRPDGTVYLCGLSDTKDPLPLDSSQVKGDPEKGKFLFEFAKTVLVDVNKKYGSDDDSLAIKNKLGYSSHACFLPTPADRRRPIIGVIPETDNSLFVASGHTCWGILNSHGTGLAIREMIQESHPQMFLEQHNKNDDDHPCRCQLKNLLEKLQPSFMLENEVPEELRKKNSIAVSKRKNENW